MEARLKAIESLHQLHPTNAEVTKWAPDLRNYTIPIISAQAGLEHLLEQRSPGPTTSHVAHLANQAGAAIREYRKYLDATLFGSRPHDWAYAFQQGLLELWKGITEIDDGWPVSPWTPLDPDWAYIGTLTHGMGLVVMHADALRAPLFEAGFAHPEYDSSRGFISTQPEDAETAVRELLFMLDLIEIAFRRLEESLANPPGTRTVLAFDVSYGVHYEVLSVVRDLALIRSRAAQVQALLADRFPASGPPDHVDEPVAFLGHDVSAAEGRAADVVARLPVHFHHGIEQLVAVIDPLLEAVPPQYAENLV